MEQDVARRFAHREAEVKVMESARRTRGSEERAARVMKEHDAYMNRLAKVQELKVRLAAGGVKVHPAWSDGEVLAQYELLQQRPARRRRMRFMIGAGLLILAITIPNVPKVWCHTFGCPTAAQIKADTITKAAELACYTKDPTANKWNIFPATIKNVAYNHYTVNCQWLDGQDVNGIFITTSSGTETAVPFDIGAKP